MKEKRRDYIISFLRCTCCGCIMPIPRRKNNLREKNHIKTMYCYSCCDIRDFLENYSQTDADYDSREIDSGWEVEESALRYMEAG